MARLRHNEAYRGRVRFLQNNRRAVFYVVKVVTNSNHSEQLVDACLHLADDLCALGAPADAIAEVVTFYERALSERSEDAWKRFYVATFQCLRALEDDRPAVPAQFETAARSLLSLLEDDFGAILIDESDVARLRRQFRLDSNAHFQAAVEWKGDRREAVCRVM